MSTLNNSFASVLMGLLTVVTVTVRASTHYVWQASTNPQHPYTSWDTAAHDIQSALDAAENDALVLVTNGTYTLTQQLVITNALTLRSTNGREHTVIAAGAEPNRSRCLHVNGVNAWIEGFTFSNGYATVHAGGVYLQGGGTLADCTIIGNVADGDDKRGGGVYLLNGGTVTNCLMMGNSAGEGGGAAINGGGGLITTSVITNNTAVRSGGGVFLSTLGTALVDSRVQKNTCPGNRNDWGGGGVYISGNGWAQGCLIEGNSATWRGGGVLIYRATEGAVVGGLLDCVVSNNVSVRHGGGVMFTSLSPHAQRGTLRRCRIVNNRAVHLGGGVHGSTVGSEIIVENSLIANNESTGTSGSTGGYHGGGTLLNTTITGNHASNDGFVGGIYCTANTVLTNCIVALNTSSDSLYPNYRDEALATWSHSLTPDVVAGVEMVVGDPWFEPVLSGAFRPRSGSPAIDKGTPEVPYHTDIDGFPHVDYTRSGVVRPDIGCFERPPPVGTTLVIR